MRYYLFFCLLFMPGAILFAQDRSRVIGVWLTQDQDCHIRISEDECGQFNGVTAWVLKATDEHGDLILDVKNPKKELRQRQMLGLGILQGFVYDSVGNRWSGGTIYDPTNGKSYKSILKVSDDMQKLHVRGYVGVSLIGREVVWTRIE